MNKKRIYWGGLCGLILGLIAIIAPFPAMGEETRIEVKRFNIEGNTMIDTATLLSHISPYSRQMHSLKSLKKVADYITFLYQEKGYILSRAYVPNQDIVEGVVTIWVIEGKLGRLIVSDSKYYSSWYVHSWMRRLQGEVIKERDIERTILLLNDTPSLKVKTAFQKGEEPGTADLIVDIEDSLPIKLDFEYNNYGNPDISKRKIAVHMEATDPLLGSTLDLQAMMGDSTENTFLGAITYSLPINRIGTRTGTRYIKSNYLIGGELQDIGIEGDSAIWSLFATHSWLRGQKKNLSTTLTLDQKRQQIFVLGQPLIEDRLTILTAGVDYDLPDKRGGANYLSVSLARGLGELLGGGGSSNEKSSRQGAGGEFNKLRFHYERYQALWKKLLLRTKVSGQYTTDRLVSSEQLGVGGIYTVRGYALSEHSGDYGYTFSGEVSFPPPFLEKRSFRGKKVGEMVRFHLFFDHGAVFNNGKEKNSNFLSSTGLGFKAYPVERVSLRFDTGFPMEGTSPQFSESVIYIQAKVMLLEF